MLWRKMLRDMARQKTQFASIFLMSFLALFVYSGVGGEWHGLRTTADAFYADAALADAWVYAEGILAEDAEAVAKLSAVAATDRRVNLEASAAMDGEPSIDLNFVESGSVSRLEVFEGSGFSQNDAGGVWLSASFAQARGLAVGDDLELKAHGMTLSKTIRGLVYSPEHIYSASANSVTPDFNAHGAAWISMDALREALAVDADAELSCNTLLVRFAEGTDAFAMEESVSSCLGGGNKVYVTRSAHPSVATFNNEIEQHRVMGDIFPVVFVAIALLIISTTMTRVITAQRTQIGTLKALGFGNAAITRHYVGYGLFLALAGSVFGLALGPLSMPYLFYPSMSGFYSLPVWEPAFSVSFLWMAALVVALCTAAAWLAARRQLSEAPAAALRPKPPQQFSSSWLESLLSGRLGIWSRMGFNARWNARDAQRHKVRACMAVVGVLGCTALFLCGLSMKDSLDDLKTWQFERSEHYASKLVLATDASSSQIDSLKAVTSGEALLETAVEIRRAAGGGQDSAGEPGGAGEPGSAGDPGGAGERKSGTLTVTDGVSLISPSGANLEPVELPGDGVALTAKMAAMLGGLEVGDVIEWHVYEPAKSYDASIAGEEAAGPPSASGGDYWTRSVVAAIYRSPATQGIQMSRAHFESLGFSFRPSALVTSEPVGAAPAGVEYVADNAGVMERWEEFTESMYTMVYVLAVSAAVLSVVVLYNLGVLAFTESRREMATLKVLGFKTRVLRGMLLTQNLWFSALGFLLGLPLAYLLTQVIVGTAGDSYDFPVAFHWQSVLAAFVFTFGFSMLVNLMFSRRISKLSMVETLKAAE